ncbi:Hpt domain-containing protein [Microbulbifer rhizosphaerae]|uniref:HPt (Histidine-containing phosphotransfer) domain-containing protein n=1 Tax=Microbulbifer rhizosphaerae TaxID=1562603 RepID=A0A7W4Z9T8_9GAMM|nr:Hpt domain-containing protein [Microbulbifer rhizosphaerae]MBB3062037.1 HPt (histidine-containing phosphotransfer) domain-containing protein [Microbulbifer rhizosphaerae]
MSTFEWHKALADLDGDEEILRDLAEVFLAEADAMTDAVRNAVEWQHAAELRRSAHSLKGAVRVFHADAAAAAAFHLETLGRDANFQGADRALAKLEEEVGRLCRELGNHLQNEPPPAS